jgi:hypothetical protein
MHSKYPILTALLIWLALPAAIALMLWLTPFLTTRTADAGAFLSARPWAGSNIWGNPVTTVQTTRGTIAVDGIFSALRGEPLMIRDTNKDGMVVCAVRPPATCAELSGSFVGAFTPVPGVRVWLPHWLRWWLHAFSCVWAVLGAIYFLAVWLDVHDDGDDCDDDTGKTDPTDVAKEPWA